VKECEVALKNKQGPGPGTYNSAHAEIKVLRGSQKDKYTIS